jgi:hypothetical protein
MRSYSTATLAALQARTAISARSLIWITAKDRTTGAAESIGFWNGDDNQTFTIDGADRIFYAAGAMIGIDPIIMGVGAVVQMQRVTLSAIAPEVEQAIRGYDTRLAPIVVYRALFETDTGNLIDAPHVVFRGSVDSVPLKRSGIGAAFTGEMTIAGASRALTRTLATMKSDADLRRRNAADAFRQYAAVAGAVPYYWGQKAP